MINKNFNNDQIIPERPKVLFFGRANCDASNKAIKHLKKLGFQVVHIFSQKRGELIPGDVLSWSGDYILCFRSHYILPTKLISRAKFGAVNFHPGSPEFPGSGCLNFALYENSPTYGVTAHLIEDERVDSGKILEARRFDLHVTDDVNSLIERTHLKLLDLFFDMTTDLFAIGPEYFQNKVQTSKEEWSGVNRRMIELENLSSINKDISRAELKKIIRATYTPLFPTKIFIHGYEFILKK